MTAEVGREDFFLYEHFFNDVNEMLCKESPSLALKIFDALKDFIASLKQYISDVRK